MKTLIPGANTVISTKGLIFDIAWTPARLGDQQVDVAIFLLGSDGKVHTESDFLLCAQPASNNGISCLLSDEDQVILQIDLDYIVPSVAKIVIAITTRGMVGFAAASALKVVVKNLAYFEPMTQGMNESALILCEVYKHKGTWKLRAIGQGFVGGMEALLAHYGVHSRSKADAASNQPEETISQNAPPASIATQDAVQSAAAQTDEPAPLGNPTSAPAQQPQTAKPRRHKTSGKKLKHYRFALYGATSAGKTTLLAALAMKRIPPCHANYSCIRVPLGQSPAASSQDSRESDPHVSRHAILKASYKKLDEAISALQNGHLPEPTPADHPTMYFDYTFGTGQRTYHIELIDYSGESLDSTLSANERATRLRTELKDKDALLVLAPAPRDHQTVDKDDEDSARFQSLLESFGLLHQDKDETVLRMPVALILTKWDRRGVLNVNADAYDQACKNLEDFLNQIPRPPHRDLFNLLRGSVADPALDFKAFPVSALGECRADGRPYKNERLHSFGLEDPFIWAAQRRDALDIATYRREIAEQKLDRWSGKLFANPRSLTSLIRRGSELTANFPPTDRHHDEAKQLLSHVKTASAISGTVWFSLGLIILLVLEGGWDWSRYQTHKHIISDPQASGDAVQRTDTWLADYTESMPWRHFLAKISFLSNAQAESKMTSLRKGREEIYWAEVSNADPAEQIQRAEKYIEAFPNGSYKIEAINLIATAAAHKDWNEFMRTYTATLQEGKTVEASVMLKQRTADSRSASLKQSFESTALNFLETAIEKKIQDGKIDDAKELYAQIDQWPLDLDVRTDTGRRRAAQLKRLIDVAQDRQLYEEAREYKNSNALNQYLEQAPLGTMTNQVKKYLEWLNAQQGQMDLTLAVKSVTWSDDAGNNDEIQLTVTIDGEQAIKILGLESESGESSYLTSSNTYKLRARLNDEIRIGVALKDTNRWFGSGEMGTGTRKIQVKDLNGSEVPASTEEMSNTVTFSLSGIPQQPNLPIWQED